jgi:hypothetical protein
VEQPLSGLDAAKVRTIFETIIVFAVNSLYFFKRRKTKNGRFFNPFLKTSILSTVNFWAFAGCKLFYNNVYKYK